MNGERQREEEEGEMAGWREGRKRVSGRKGVSESGADSWSLGGGGC
jgi:hypothetical protein